MVKPGTADSATFYYSYTAALGTSLSQSYTVEWIINGNYTNSTCENSTVVTVSAIANDFVTGGGFLIPTNAGGRLSSLVNGVNPVNGLKNNFGFNVKYNKGGKLQGNWNTIVRRKENGKVVVYQVKSNTASSLIMTQIPGTKRYRADMTFTSANFKNLTCEVCPVDANNGIVNVTVYDNGEPGSGIDSILISIRDRDNNLWYTSEAPGSHSTVNADVKLLMQVTYKFVLLLQQNKVLLKQLHWLKNNLHQLQPSTSTPSRIQLLEIHLAGK